MSTAELVSALADLLESDPSAPLIALGSDGLTREMPESIPLGDHPLVGARSVFDLVAGSDRMGVVKAWDRARAIGSGSVTVHLVSDPDREASVHFLDALDAHGVYVGLFAGREGDPELVEISHPVPPPRIAHLHKDENAVIVDIDPATTLMLGWERDEMVGQRSLEFIHPDDQERAIDSWFAMLTANDTAQHARLRHKCRDGSWRWLEIINHNGLEDAELGYVDTEILDISDEMATQETLRKSEELLFRLAETLPLGLFQIEPGGEIVYTNSRLHDLLGVEAKLTLREQFVGVVNEDFGALESAVASALDDGEDQDVEVRLVTRSRSGIRLCRVTMRALRSADETIAGVIACVEDITESALMRVELEHRATYDALTRCHNRASIMAILDKTLARDQGAGKGTAIAFIDLDRFKPVNDRLGHAAGDDLLEVVADRLRSAVRGDDLVGRIGGDEFLVVFPDVSTAAGAMAISTRVAERLDKDVQLTAGLVDLRASIGVAWTDEPVVDSDTFVAQADSAMYESKRLGGGRPVLHTTSLPAAQRGGLGDERWVCAALDNREFTVHYQPILDLNTSRTIGYEALLRGIRDDRLVDAAEFIDLAADTGVIHEIGAWVFDEVCRQAVRQNASDSRLYWGVNVSPFQIATAGLPEMIESCIGRHGLGAERMVVEITEHEQLGSNTASRTTLHQLHELGIAIALDDFGTGWSSLELLRDLPIDCLKIDRGFVTALPDNKRARVLVDSQLELARRLGMIAVVEGIESDGQLAALLELGAEYGQGYLFSKARAPDELFGGPGT